MLLNYYLSKVPKGAVINVLGAFLSTWDSARATLGAGAPVDGAEFDSSGRLEESRQTVSAAMPGASWTGSAAQTYSDHNQHLAATLARLAELDRRLGAEVDRSAAVVAAGRRELDSVKQWVLSVAASVPPNAAGERALLPAVSKGAAEVADIVSRSNNDMFGIAARIRAIGTEYRALRSGDA